MIYDNYYIVMDCETGGLEYTKNPITEIAAVILDYKMNKIEEFSSYIKPYDNLQYEQKALDYTNITMEMINSGETVDKIIGILKQLSTNYIYMMVIWWWKIAQMMVLNTRSRA